MREKLYYPVARGLDDITDVIVSVYSGESEEILDELFLPYSDFIRKDRRALRRKNTAHKKASKRNKAALYFNLNEAEADGYSVDELLSIHHGYNSSCRRVSNDRSLTVKLNIEVEVEPDALELEHGYYYVLCDSEYNDGRIVRAEEPYVIIAYYLGEDRWDTDLLYGEDYKVIPINVPNVNKFEEMWGGNYDNAVRI